MARDWPDARGIWHNDAKNFLVWVNEEDHTRLISMETGGNMASVFKRFCDGINKVENLIKKDGYEFMWNEHLGYVLTCPSNLGTGLRGGMRKSVTVQPGYIYETETSEMSIRSNCFCVNVQTANAHFTCFCFYEPSVRQTRDQDVVQCQQNFAVENASLIFKRLLNSFTLAAFEWQQESSQLRVKRFFFGLMKFACSKAIFVENRVFSKWLFCSFVRAKLAPVLNTLLSSYNAEDSPYELKLTNPDFVFQFCCWIFFFRRSRKTGKHGETSKIGRNSWSTPSPGLFVSVTVL